jgi:hypothetical protein
MRVDRAARSHQRQHARLVELDSEDFARGQLMSSDIDRPQVD